MSDAKLKTAVTPGDVDAFIASVADPVRREDAKALRSLFERVTGEPARMWGPSIIGFGRYRYRYDSGREAEMCRAGFSPRKAEQVLYVLAGHGDPEIQAEEAALLARLGKHKTGKSCLYVKRLSDVDVAVLEEIVRFGLTYMDRKYPR